MKRTLIVSALVLVVAFPLVLASPPTSPVSTDPEISAIVGNIDANRIFNTAQTLQNFRTRQACSDQPEPGHGVTAARDFLFNQYKSIPGLQVRLDPFVHASCPTAPTFNVIAWLPGRHPNRLVIIGGHYDSRTTSVLDNTSDAPGGNDAGAQSGVVLNSRWDGLPVTQICDGGPILNFNFPTSFISSALGRIFRAQLFRTLGPLSGIFCL